MNQTSLTPSAWNDLWNVPSNRFFAAGPSYRHKMRIVWRLIEKFGLGGKVLDVACGTGELLNSLSIVATQRVGVDLSEVAVEKAKVNCPNAEFVVGNIEKEAIAGKTFNTIFCTNALEEMKDDDAALKNMAAMLDPSGNLVLVVPHRKAYWTHVDEFALNQRRYEREELVQKLESAGLKVVETVTWGWPLYRLWYGGMQRAPREKMWSSEWLRKLSRIVSEVAYTVLHLDDVFINSSRGSILVAVARKP